jgi:hypothetical protein
MGFMMPCLACFGKESVHRRLGLISRLTLKLLDGERTIAEISKISQKRKAVKPDAGTPAAALTVAHAQNFRRGVWGYSHGRMTNVTERIAFKVEKMHL